MISSIRFLCFTYECFRSFIVSLFSIVAFPFVSRFEQIDQECSWTHNGELSFLEILKTARYLETEGNWSQRSDLSQPYSVSGHSTGGRVALMLGALKDTPSYLDNVPEIAKALTPDLRAVVDKIGAVTGNHPDMMYLEKYNPDIAHFNITRTPTFIVTGSKDTTIEDPFSAWHDFTMISSPDKVFVDVSGADHSEPIEKHRCGPFVAYFSRLFALGDETVANFIYGNASTSIQNTLPIATEGEPNTGDSVVGFLACRSGKNAVPVKWAKYCRE